MFIVLAENKYNINFTKLLLLLSILASGSLNPPKSSQLIIHSILIKLLSTFIVSTFKFNWNGGGSLKS